MTRRAARAFTIVEAVLCMVVISLMLAAAFSVSGQSARARLVISEQRTADLLSRRLLAEILQKRYREQPVPNQAPEAGEDQRIRLSLDDVDDFNGLDLSPPTDASDVPIPGAANWKQRVRVELVRFDVASKRIVASATDVGLKLITVTTTSPRGVVSTVTALRCDRGLADLYTPDAGSLRSAILTLTPTGGAPMSAQVPLLNSPAP